MTALREAAGLTVRDVAKALALPSSTVGGYLVGRHLPPVRSPNLLPDLLRILGVVDEATLEEWAQALWRVRRGGGQRATAGAQAPYRGLASFQSEHAAWFYGREALTDVLIRRLVTDTPSDGPVVVVGASGSGKSSIIRAGLIPALVADADPDDEDRDAWQVALLTPGSRPLTALAHKLIEAADPSASTDAVRDRVTEAVAALRADPGTCRELTRRVLTENKEHPGLVIVVDQFEEVFTSCPDSSEREAFINALCTAADDNRRLENDGTSMDPTGRVLVVLGLRADFYPHALRYRRLTKALQDAQIAVAPMSRDELRRAITEPARSAGVSFEPGLVELLLEEIAPTGADPSVVAHDSGALPLLGHALLATWERRRHGMLTAEAYRATGGIQGAVARSAEDVYAALSPEQQSTARRLFLRLVHVADQTADTRRRVAREEILPGSADADPEDVRQVLAAFIDHRLITSSVATIELAHEALLTAWPRLRAWIDADRAGLRVHRQLGIAAASWREADQDPHMLYRGVALAAAKDWADDPAHRVALNPLELEFLTAGVDAERVERLAHLRDARRLRRLVTALTALLVLAALLAGFAFQQKNAAAQQRTVATAQRDSAISRQVAIESAKVRGTDVALAGQLAIASYRISPTPEARGALLDSWSAPAVTRVFSGSGVVQSVAVTADSQTMASGGSDGVVQVWSLAVPGSPRLIANLQTGGSSTIFSVAFSPDGHTLAAGGGAGVIRTWNVTDPLKPVALASPPAATSSTVYAVAFSPDSRMLAAGLSDDTVRLWNMADPAHPASLGQPLTGSGYVQSVAFSPNGQILAAGYKDGTVRLWDMTDPAAPGLLGAPLVDAAKAVFGVAFTPDSRTLAAGSADTTARLWNLSDPRKPAPIGQPLTGPASWVNSVAFSPDGSRLAVADSDDHIWLWDVASRQLVANLAHPGPVTGVVFLRHGATLATSAADGIVRLWWLPGPSIGPIPGTIYSTVMGPHRTLAIGSDASASLWDLTDPRAPAPRGPALLPPPGAAAFSGTVQTSPDGNTIAIGGVDGSVRLWDISDATRPQLLPVVLTGATTPVETIAFAPDGHTLAVGANEALVRLWDVTDPRQPKALTPLKGPTNYIFSLAFSPDGRTLAAGSADDSVWLWNVTDPARAAVLGKPLTRHTNYVYTVAFSPDGRTLASSSADETIELWNVADPARPALIGKPLSGPNSVVYAAVFGPGGTTIAGSTSDGTVWIWDITNPARPRVLETLTGPGGALLGADLDRSTMVLSAGGKANVVRLWDVDVNQTMQSICSTAGNPITAEEWNRYIPDTAYDPPCK